MTKKRVFLSFIAEDVNKVRGLRLLAANPGYDLEFYDESVRTPFDSTNSEYIRSKIREKIRRSSVTVLLVSEDTHKSRWVAWELEESHRQGNRIVVMALKGVASAVLPSFVTAQGLEFHAWDPQGLDRLIQGY